MRLSDNVTLFCQRVYRWRIIDAITKSGFLRFLPDIQMELIIWLTRQEANLFSLVERQYGPARIFLFKSNCDLVMRAFAHLIPGFCSEPYWSNPKRWWENRCYDVSSSNSRNKKGFLPSVLKRRKLSSQSCLALLDLVVIREYNDVT